MCPGRRTAAVKCGGCIEVCIKTVSMNELIDAVVQQVSNNRKLTDK
jgi:hypothetical protein